jgi:hypothetical protein
MRDQVREDIQKRAEKEWTQIQTGTYERREEWMRPRYRMIYTGGHIDAE